MFDGTRGSRQTASAWRCAALLALACVAACDGDDGRARTVESVQRRDTSGKAAMKPDAHPTGPQPLLRRGPFEEDVALRGILDLARTTKSPPESALREALLELARHSREAPLVHVDDDAKGGVLFQGRVPNPRGSDEGAARAMVTAWFAQLALGRGLVLEERRHALGEAGDLHLRYALRLRDPALGDAALPVWKADLTAHFAADGALTALNTAGLQRVTPRRDLRIDAATARRLVQRHLAGAGGALDAVMDAPVMLGVWVGRAADDAHGLLAWRVESARWTERGPVVRATFVDAATGAIIDDDALSYYQTATPTVGTARDYNGQALQLQVSYWPAEMLYGLLDQSAPAGRGRISTYDGKYVPVNAIREVSLVTSASLSSWDVAGATAHANGRKVLDYFANALGRSSWDGAGGNLNLIVHVGQNWANASFTGGSTPVLMFGDGGGTSPLLELPRCLDVMAHEVAHGVVETTVDLAYEGESGALNESFADVFGAMVDREDWLIGEDCSAPSLGYLRSMVSPAQRNQPEHLRDYERSAYDEEGDWGGVHTNSGIPNRAAALVGQARGKEKLEQIWYRVLKDARLSRSAGFAQMALATGAACRELLREDRATGDDCAAVDDAWRTVGVALPAGACPANATAQNGLCVCADGFTPSADASSCLPLATVACGPNMELLRGECYCREGFVNIAGTCTDDPRACPSNSRYDTALAKCVCNDGFEGDPFGREQGCTAVTSDCGANAHPRTDPITQARECVCNDGYQPNPARTACELIPGTCGGETFYGRCAGTTLVYCEDDVVQVVECGEEGLTCGFRASNIGMDCLNPSGIAGGGACDDEVDFACDDASPMCITDSAGIGYCSHECASRSDCADPFACCGQLTSGILACLKPEHCPEPTDPRSECTDVPGGSTLKGRCTDRDVLVYCDPLTHSTQEIDCRLLGEVCGLESAERGYNCVARGTGSGTGTTPDACASSDDGVCDVPWRCPADSDVRDCHPCGDVTSAGACAGNLLRTCDPALGLVETDCGAVLPRGTCQVDAGAAACRAAAPPTDPVPAVVEAVANEAGCSLARSTGASALSWCALAWLLGRRRRRRAS